MFALIGHAGGRLAGTRFYQNARDRVRQMEGENPESGGR